MNTTAEKLADLRKKLELAQEPAGEAGVAKRAKKGIPSARERIDMFLDAGSFVEIGALMRNPNIKARCTATASSSATARIDGRPVRGLAHDQTVYGGSVGEMFGRKVARSMQYAAETAARSSAIQDSGGARVQEAVVSLAWYADSRAADRARCPAWCRRSRSSWATARRERCTSRSTPMSGRHRERAHVRHRPEGAPRGDRRGGQPRGAGRRRATRPRYGNIHHVAKDERPHSTGCGHYLSLHALELPRAAAGHQSRAWNRS